MDAIYDVSRDGVSGEACWALLDQVSILMNRMWTKALSKTRVTPEQFAVLNACVDLEVNDIIATTAELSRVTGLRSQSMTGLVNRMEEKGLIHRTPKRRGMPYTKLALTETGKNLRAEASTRMDEVLAGMSKWLNAKDEKALEGALTQVRDKVAEQLHIEVEAMQQE